jgi:hypothetical protein
MVKRTGIYFGESFLIIVRALPLHVTSQLDLCSISPGASFLAQFILGALRVVNEFSAPVATQRLLNYLERGGKESVLRPWVWVLWLALGPAIASVAQQFIAWLIVSIESKHGSVHDERFGRRRRTTFN